jgi:uncharacterized protein (DUF169 family)
MAFFSPDFALTGCKVIATAKHREVTVFDRGMRITRGGGASACGAAASPSTTRQGETFLAVERARAASDERGESRSLP